MAIDASKIFLRASNEKPLLSLGEELFNWALAASFCILEILCFTNGEKNRYPDEPLTYRLELHRSRDLELRLPLHFRFRTVLHCAPLRMSIPYKGRRGHRPGRWAAVVPR